LKTERNKTYLSKSLFIRGLQCHKSLWLQKFRPELRDEISKAQQVLFAGGTEVGIYAQQLFPNGLTIPYDGLSHAEQLKKTAAAISEGVETIYEGAFSHDEVFVKADILHRDRAKGGRFDDDNWDIYEVKSATSQKDVYLDDLALQYHVLTGAGLPVSRAFIIHINNQYVRQGAIDIRQLFTIIDLTEEVRERQPFIIEELDTQRHMLRKGMPTIDIGAQCENPYTCDFLGHCWSNLPEMSVFNVRGRGLDRFGLYRTGVTELKDIPQECLSSDQKIQVECYLRQTNVIRKEPIREFLQTLSYPLYFLDFETFMTAVPPFDGTRPYQQIPFQYSLHWQKKAGSDLSHDEFLASPGEDPREKIAQRLAETIPSKAFVLAYNASFEASILRELSRQYPEYTEELDAIIANMKDLMEPFKKKDLYFWQMNGSYSLKAVLPLLVPELTYDGMEVSDGGMAMEAYARMCKAEDPEESARIRKALLDYCSLDTLAMIRILEVLDQLSA
jgi:hypothetical protein